MRAIDIFRKLIYSWHYASWIERQFMVTLSRKDTPQCVYYYYSHIATKSDGPI